VIHGSCNLHYVLSDITRLVEMCSCVSKAGKAKASEEGLNSEVYAKCSLWIEDNIKFRIMVVKNKLYEKVGATCSMTRGIFK
jgi:hypothetical protein